MYFIFLFRRRRRVTSGPIPLATRVAFALSIIPILGLWVNVVGAGFKPNAAPYALAFTWLLMVGGWVFIQNLELFFGHTPAR